MKIRIMGMLAATLLAVTGPALADKSAGERVDDSTVAAEVKAGLASEKGVPVTDVNVEVYKGVVLLSGFVTSQAAKVAAGKVAKGTKGAA